MAIDHPSTRSKAKAFTGVPRTWEGWMVRMLTFMVALLFVAIFALFDRIAEVDALVDVSRTERIVYQEEQRLRSCLMLVKLETAPVQMEAVGC